VAADLPTPIVFPCPNCKRFVTIDPTDSVVVRQTGGDRRLLRVRVTCPACGRLIVRSLIRQT